MVDPATLPDVLPAPSKKEEEGERKIDLSEIIGLPDFDVCPSISTSFSCILLSFVELSFLGSIIEKQPACEK
jgi:hypothetical protein